MLTNKLKNMRKKKLSWEILIYACSAVMASMISYIFLSLGSYYIADIYMLKKGRIMSIEEEILFGSWVTAICFAAAVIIFIFIFLFLVGQKVSYIIYINKGINRLKSGENSYRINVEGSDELAELAENINYLYESNQRILDEEKRIKEKREEMVRSLSHDIRTPLTSIIAYSDIIEKNTDIDKEKLKEYISIVRSRAIHIKNISDLMLETANRQCEYIEDGILMLNQLCEEIEFSLDENILCSIETDGCMPFEGCFDIGELRRIMDNIVSNINKYAEKSKPVNIRFKCDGEYLEIFTENTILKEVPCDVESNKIGLKSIKQIVNEYDGEFETIKKDGKFIAYIKIKCLKP